MASQTNPSLYEKLTYPGIEVTAFMQASVLPKCCPACGGNRFQPVERHLLETAEADTKKGYTFPIGESELTKNPQEPTKQGSKVQ
jgi:hypothetical protein